MKNIRWAATMVAMSALAAPAALAQAPMPWMDTTLPPDQRAALLVSAMTLTEKVQQIAMKPVANTSIPGCGFTTVGRHIEGIPRLAIPTVRMINAPAGVVGGDCTPDPVTTGLPDELSAAASFDAALWSRYGDVIGNETRSAAHTITLGPGMDMGRVPNNGRNFEYLGEDPLLTGTAAVLITQGIQANGVLATPKHYVANEQETQRQTMNTVIDDRTLHELYLLPFEMVVKDGDTASLMCSYPRVNGTYSCENTLILRTVLRDQWGFKGFVMSDRSATKSTVASIKAGLDLEFASPSFFSPANISTALATGAITLADIDAMLQPRFYTMFKAGQFDNPITGFSAIDFNTHGLYARAMAEQGSVLLKNANSILPLSTAGLRSIALIGPPTFAGKAVLAGNGPSATPVNAPYTITPAQGLQNVLTALGSGAAVTYNDGKNLASAAALAASADVVIVMLGDISVEGVDRSTLGLPIIDTVDQNALISAVAAANPKTVVVLKNGGPVLLPWLNQVPALLEAWYPGQEDGNAVAELLFGLANPSGKLPITFPTSERIGATATVSQWPGVFNNGILTATYAEGLQMGYRWYDANGVKPQFPFGFGLSYTSFTVGSLSVQPSAANDRTPLTVQFTVTNTGARAGAEVPQVYLGLPASSGEPPKRLVGFKKVYLNPGESQVVQVTVNPMASNHPMSVWDTGSQTWVAPGGTYQVSVGTSSGQLSATTSINVQHVFGRK